MSKTKNNAIDVLDSLFWWTIMLFPVLGWLFSFLPDNSQNYTFASFMADVFNYPVSENNVAYTTLLKLFGSDGYLPMAGVSDSLCMYLSYMVYVQFGHMVFDVIVFLPRLCHDWIDSFGRCLK